jgi:tetratricopeptide (TPR) repeat protein
MSKPGRNDSCPCGSGKKYKRCCLPAELQAKRLEASQRAPPFAPSPRLPSGWVLDDEDGLDELSNRAVDLIHAGRLEEAERACRELKERFPETIDWLDRTAMLYERRGEPALAADYYRRCLQLMTDDAEAYDDEGRAWMQEKIHKLESQVAAGA